VNRVGFGAMQLAGDETPLVLRAAVESGVNHIDTAQYYGPVVVNELIRKALSPFPDDLAIVSKVAARPDTGGAALRRGIEANLETLGTSRLAAVNLRIMDPSAPPDKGFDAQLAALINAREERLIDGIGLSNISRRHLLRALEHTEIVCVQNLFNVADQRSRDVLEECVERNIAFVPYCPLGWPRNQLLASPLLATVAARLSATPAQIALAWLLDLAPNVLLIPGTRTPAHLTENLHAADIQLDAAARAELDRLGEPAHA
jgi:aryl-alcohol dehydrogenase-like predicted oxidoreductase